MNIFMRGCAHYVRFYGCLLILFLLLLLFFSIMGQDLGLKFSDWEGNNKTHAQNL